MKKNTLKISFSCLLFCLLFCFFDKISAQSCATGQPFSSGENTTKAVYRGGIVTIPVVVHVVYNEPVENISDEQIFSQIDVLNQDFRQKNNQSNLPNDFKTLAADLGLEFCLAKTSPSGKTTKGITRTFTTSQNIWHEKGNVNGVSKRRVYASNLEGQDAWDTKKYLNIWVCRMPSDKSGYATFPGQTKNNESDGIVIDYRYFGTLGIAATNTPFHLGKTAVHEVGHYFNLSHLWGESISNPDCSDDDGVSDTPAQSAPVSACPNSPVMQCGKSVMYQNFMNYTQDDCMSLFTNGQKMRMLDALMLYRKELINAQGCNPTDSFDVQTADIQVFPNPATDFLYVRNAENAIFQLYDLQGRCVANKIISSNYFSFEIGEFSQGIYQVGIIIGKEHIVKKIHIL